MAIGQKNNGSVIGTFKSVLNRAETFTWFFIGWNIIGTALLKIIGNHQLFLKINQWYSSGFDFFFTYFTYVGDGLFNVFVSVLLLLDNKWRALLLLVCFGVSGGLSTLFKRVIFGDYHRPVLYFQEEGIPIRMIEGLAPPAHYSFPSGHSITAFSAFMLLALFYKKPSISVLCIMAAILTGFSRIYLSAHFPADVLVGGIIGVGSNVLVLYIIAKFYPIWFEKANLL
jgi:membrane-associated phospholipid phosphatase